MKIICDKCDYVIDRDKIIEGEVVEEYKNIYGTTCPNCKNIIRPYKKPQFVKDNELKLELLRNQVREKIKNLRRKNNVN